jgi:hypothetical protein
MKLIWNKNTNLKNDDKERIFALEQFNFKFIQSLSTVIEPFLDKLKKIHGSKVELNNDEKANLKRLIDLLKMYSTKESSLVTALSIKDSIYNKILGDLNRELAIVEKIAKDAENEKIQDLYSSCEALKKDLLILQNDFANKEKKLAA